MFYVRLIVLRDWVSPLAVRRTLEQFLEIFSFITHAGEAEVSRWGRLALDIVRESYLRGLGRRRVLGDPNFPKGAVGKHHEARYRGDSG